MNLKKVGSYIYYASLVLAIAILIISRLIINSIPNLTEEVVLKYWYFTEYIVFGIVLPFGVLVREYILLPHVKSLMLVKVFIYIIEIVVCMSLYFVLNTLTIAKVILYISYFVIIVSIFPSSAIRSFFKRSIQ